MTELEKKAQELQQGMEQAKAEAKTAKEAVEAVKSELAAKDAEIKTAQTNINNLDKSVKEQAETIEKLSNKLEKRDDAPLSIKQFIGAFLEEHKEEMQKKMAQENGRFRFQTKTVYDISTGLVNPNYSLSLQSDNEISAARRGKNIFIEMLGLAQRTADKLSWIEGTTQDVVGYVDEDGQNTNKGDSSIAEVQRAYGKLQTSLIITTEVSDWYPVFRDWAENEAHAALLNKLDSEILAGEGADTNSSTKKKIYGLKTHATAWDALADHILDANANYADAIFNACEQISNAGYNPDVAFVSPVVYFKLRCLKDTSGNYILDRATDVLVSDSRTVKVVKALKLTNNEFLVMDLTCCKPYAGNSFEVEGVRDADYDRWKFFFRICAQNKIKTDWTKGIIYCADADNAVKALAPEAGVASNESKL